MSEHAIDHQTAPQGGVVVPFRSKPVADAQKAPEWRPMLPPDLFTPEIGADGIAVYGVLCLYVDGQTGNCWPSQDTVAKRIGLTRKRVNLAIKVLEMFGLVMITHQYDRGMKRSNLYHLPHQKPANVQMSRIDTTLYPGDTTDVPQGDNRCVTEVHKPNVIEPDDKEPERDAPAKPQRRKSSHSIPDDFTLTDERRAYAIGKGFDDARVEVQFERFVNHAKANDRRQVDWDRSWQNWVLGDVQRNGKSTPFPNGNPCRILSDAELDAMPLPETVQPLWDKKRDEFYEYNDPAAPFPPANLEVQFRDMKRKFYANGGVR